MFATTDDICSPLAAEATDYRSPSPQPHLAQPPVLESAVITDETSPAGPGETAWETFLGEQVQNTETATGARGELVELLLWAVAAGRLPAERARIIAAEARPGAQEHAGVSAVTWRKRRSRTGQQLRAVAGQWV
ncbi:hypothetical protein ABZ438_20350 [Streptomyces sp. NPDC005786]|uniref:hypothetical protein n=1 Tax=unclassified Streptomyces TaxID=2593676 RepID=UPI0033CFA9A5